MAITVDKLQQFINPKTSATHLPFRDAQWGPYNFSKLMVAKKWGWTIKHGTLNNQTWYYNILSLGLEEGTLNHTFIIM